ncbi:MAG: fibronectin type III domain-containing protein, partial [Treponema sp.]|nr:fibronectin type III domain-containing protein [Treponema sp.]
MIGNVRTVLSSYALMHRSLAGYFLLVYISVMWLLGCEQPTDGFTGMINGKDNTVPAPENTTIEPSSSESITITWDPVPRAVGYKVYRSEDGTTYGNTPIYETEDSQITSYEDTGLKPTTQYTYKVSAYNAAGECISSAYTGMTYPTTTLTVSVTAMSSSSITITWAAVTGAIGYNIYRGESANGTYTKINTVQVTSTSYNDTGLTASKIYYYKVAAYNNGGEGDKSVYKSTITYPSIPTDISARGASSSSIRITWDAVTGASGYNIYRSTSADGEYAKA